MAVFVDDEPFGFFVRRKRPQLKGRTPDHQARNPFFECPSEQPGIEAFGGP